MIGTPGGGKTTLLYRLFLGETITTIPTYGFNIERINIEGFNVTIWDIGGNWYNRGLLWRHYSEGSVGIISVVDSTDEFQFEEAKDRLWRVYEEYGDEQLGGSVLLVYANKQDCLHAMSVAEMRDRLELETRAGGRRWHIQGCTATTGAGLTEGMEWMVAQLKSKTWHHA
ncbi:hypothetical protein BG015_009076 [Linnemannia schmuckeri]|uniref:ADP-ribosylation factor n=1 Tax=Linnemannia schmuckeri TaxID=64567 RepID=A0A9P5VA81_9FUNG|nr:hypothetical protein BG015_009076 [Linnemannia schmuckeri]